MTTKLTNEEARRLLESRRLAGRLSGPESAVVLGFNADDIPVLVAKGHLKPLGRPSNNATKYFASTRIIQHSSDPAWLDHATMIIAKHWQAKNQRKRKSRP